MNWPSIKSALLTPISYIRSVHSESTPDSHGRWTVTAFMAISCGILGHAQAHHLPLDPTVSTTLLGIGGLVLGRATAAKIFGEKESSSTLDSRPSTSPPPAS
jgi:hypothetical protein